MIGYHYWKECMYNTLIALKFAFFEIRRKRYHQWMIGVDFILSNRYIYWMKAFCGLRLIIHKLPPTRPHHHFQQWPSDGGRIRFQNNLSCHLGLGLCVNNDWYLAGYNQTEITCSEQRKMISCWPLSISSIQTKKIPKQH